MTVHKAGLGPAQWQNTAAGGRLASDARFRDILALMQDDGVVALDAGAPVERLAAGQKARLQESFDIHNMGGLANKRALLNELVRAGALTAEESELSTMQLLPPAGPDGMFAHLAATPGYEEMLNEPDYLAHLEQATAFDQLWGRADDVKDARKKLLRVLQDIFG